MLTRLASRSIVLTAAVAVLLPTQLLAQQPASAEPARAIAVRDVALGENGQLAGAVVDAQGQTQRGVAVVLSQAGEPLAQATTDSAGRFVLTAPRGGVYRVEAAGGAMALRLWTCETAPPGAAREVLVVAGDTVARAQGLRSQGLFRSDAFLIGATVIAAVIIPLAIHNSRRDDPSGS